MYPKLELEDYFDQESERLLYRKLSKGDIVSWSEFFVDNPNLPYLGGDFSSDTMQASSDWINKQLDRYKECGTGLLGVIEKESGELIGVCGLLSREVEGENEYEVAYSLKPAYWKKGYGTEMARQIKIFGVEHKLAPRFISLIHKDNIGSIKVAKNNGMDYLFDSEYMGMPVVVFGNINNN